MASATYGDQPQVRQPCRGEANADEASVSRPLDPRACLCRWPALRTEPRPCTAARGPRRRGRSGSWPRPAATQGARRRAGLPRTGRPLRARLTVLRAFKICCAWILELVALFITYYLLFILYSLFFFLYYLRLGARFKVFRAFVNYCVWILELDLY